MTLGNSPDCPIYKVRKLLFSEGCYRLNTVILRRHVDIFGWEAVFFTFHGKGLR